MSKRTATRATTITSYEQVMSLQGRLVSRSVLSPRMLHDIDDAYETVRDTVCIHCSCGEWLQFPVDGSEQQYVGHVTTQLRSRLAVAA